MVTLLDTSHSTRSTARAAVHKVHARKLVTDKSGVHLPTHMTTNVLGNVLFQETLNILGYKLTLDHKPAVSVNGTGGTQLCKEEAEDMIGVTPHHLTDFRKVRPKNLASTNPQDLRRAHGGALLVHQIGVLCPQLGVHAVKHVLKRVLTLSCLVNTVLGGAGALQVVIPAGGRHRLLRLLLLLLGGLQGRQQRSHLLVHLLDRGLHLLHRILRHVSSRRRCCCCCCYVSKANFEEKHLSESQYTSYTSGGVGLQQY
mmetsp:Transcript_21266/g.39544  ORF Transcript_21266/g.39544 Transcript_21266/m.39544 type:complete len:256 (-) Transcript_21266:2436-3203(-)